MLEKKYKNIVYFITLAIIATIIAQVYWNIKNYEVNRRQVINQIQTSFDNSIEKYFSEIAKKDVFTLLNLDSTNTKQKHFSLNNLNSNKTIIIENSLDSMKIDLTKERTDSSDSIQIRILGNSKKISFQESKQDSLILKEFTNKIWFSFQENSINLKEIDKIFTTELDRKNISIQHGMKYETSNFFSNKTEVEKYNLVDFPENHLSIISNSSFLPKDSKLELLYTNTTSEILKRMLGSIFLSLILSGIIVGCLLFLLNTIFKQKQLSEVKNDLISNITHEFKTPIATIGVALESIKKFNALDDVTKTQNYLDISNNQLDKLNLMVEKLLETATLDSNNLDLNKEKINISDLLESIIQKHQIQLDSKHIQFNKNLNSVFAKVDAFHFESAINNIIDNAVKYGGNNIEIRLNQQENHFEILISDDGKSLTKANKDRVFEKFYRVPKGNTHDIKGFGIGLYYAKKIIEKHHGTIDLELKNNLTTFKISLPNE